MPIKPLTPVALLLSLFLISCEDNNPKHEQLIIRTGIPQWTRDGNLLEIIPMDSVEVNIYKSELELFMEENAVYHGFSNAAGVLIINHPLNDTLYISARKNHFNYKRFYEPAIQRFLYAESTTDLTRKYLNCYLSTTPTRLHLKIVNSSGPVSDAEVQLYLSVDDLLADKKPQEDCLFTDEVYGMLDELDCLQRREKLHDIFTSRTNQEGIATFHNLEPRKYWFKISGPGFTSQSDNNTGSSLADNPDLTTQILISVQ